MLTLRRPFLDTFSLMREALHSYEPNRNGELQWSVKKDEDALTILAPLPGVQADAINVQVEKGVLALAVQRDVQVPEGARCLREESSSWSAHYRYALPEEVDAEQISAEYSKGIVRIVMKLKQAAEPRRIDVRQA